MRTRRMWGETRGLISSLLAFATSFNPACFHRVLERKDGIWYPTLEDITNIHDAVIKWLGGDNGVVNLGSAAAAIDFARGASPIKVDLGLFARAAFFLRGIAQDHPFTDGNKRTGLVVTWAFLVANGFHVEASANEAERFMLEVAQAKVDLPVMADWLRSRATKLK